MDVKELRNKTPDELNRMAAELKAQVRDMRFKLATHQLTKMKGLHEAKKDLARIATCLTAAKNART